MQGCNQNARGPEPEDLLGECMTIQGVLVGQANQPPGPQQEKEWVLKGDFESPHLQGQTEVRAQLQKLVSSLECSLWKALQTAQNPERLSLLLGGNRTGSCYRRVVLET